MSGADCHTWVCRAYNRQLKSTVLDRRLRLGQQWSKFLYEFDDVLNAGVFFQTLNGLCCRGQTCGIGQELEDG